MITLFSSFRRSKASSHLPYMTLQLKLFGLDEISLVVVVSSSTPHLPNYEYLAMPARQLSYEYLAQKVLQLNNEYQVAVLKGMMFGLSYHEAGYIR